MEFSKANLDSVLNGCSLALAELNQMDSNKLTTNLSMILRDFSYSFKRAKVKFLPMSIELADDELSEIEWTGIRSAVQKTSMDFVRIL
ncbi:hypothetical protein [Legionella drozanskii]|uniref:Uncharacterized protein n=1 Tax=Legionella drozanskii LLAP-1 TaxID=1212489 RepID=A0A0W0TDI9_9GAMM|nr:hypothetical protein [Legionella drozanskii]KTC93679.1 hypothetical protein Ldro_0029 [Legionella drozanskii LLAP-1]